jgi:hypothetical protein
MFNKTKEITNITIIDGKKFANFSLVIFNIFKPIAITRADPTAPISIITLSVKYGATITLKSVIEP